jgi:chromosomal replication initiator protein
MGLVGSAADTRSDSARSAADIWNEVLGYLRVRVNKEGFETWLGPTRGAALVNGSIEVTVPSAFFADWLGQHYASDIGAALLEVAGRELEVVFRPSDNIGADTLAPRVPQPNGRNRADSYRLQPRHTFASFIIGESNRFACAAARSVAENPGRNYNPLFIYGGVGLGKTHLLQAVGNHALTIKSDLKVLYTPAEALFLELIQSIEKNTRLQFKNKYRALDLLLLDDIHYLIGKERLQEEIFHIFNALHEVGSQIVFTSDRPPREIPTLESRLASRLGSGLVVDIQQPELETRLAILKQKAAAEHVVVPDDVAYFVAHRVRTSVRELEGALIRLLALSSLGGRQLSVDTAAEALSDILPHSEPPDHNRIIAACAESFGVTVAEIRGTRRTKQLALARQVAMYIMRSTMNLSLKEIGFLFGGKDHTTVLHAVNKIQDLRTNDAGFAAKVERIAKGITR